MGKIISIDTSDNKKISVQLNLDGKTYEITSGSTILKSEAILPLIDKVLRKNNLGINKIDGINVNTGPGSYTGLRVGASVANALGFLLKIRINNKKIGELARPVYNK